MVVFGGITYLVGDLMRAIDECFRVDGFIVLGLLVVLLCASYLWFMVLGCRLVLVVLLVVVVFCLCLIVLLVITCLCAWFLYLN